MSGFGSINAFLTTFFLQSLPISFLKICILIAAAYLFSRGPLFRRLFLFRTSATDKLKVFVFFAALVLLEVGINPSRFHRSSLDFFTNQDMSVGLVTSVTAGFFVGPGMGFAVGALTWLVTMASSISNEPMLGPFLLRLILNPGIAAIVGGLLGGWMMRLRPTPREQYLAGFLVGAFGEVVWLSIGLLSDTSTTVTAAGFAPAWSATIVSGGIGVLTFLWIISDIKAQHERIGSVQIQRALRIANQTLPFLRQGLNAESAGSIAEIVYEFAEVGAVALTDGSRILAHIGAGADHHRAGDLLAVTFPKESLDLQEVVLGPHQVGCGRSGCPLTSGVLSPLVHEDEGIGGVIIYGVDGSATSPEMVRLGVGLAQFFSNYQVELAALERQTQAVSQAELKALQSQVHPHFLFNVLNTLAALCEIDPRQAGKLTVRLATFLRRSLRESPAPLIPVRDELENVRSYVEIELARFQDRLTVEETIADDALDALVPSFGLQILVENAILHGMSKKKGPGRVAIRVRRSGERLTCIVQDEGPGFTPERQAEVFSGDGRASGLRVLHERGRRLLGRSFRLRVVSRHGSGTTVVMVVPQSIDEARSRERSRSIGVPGAAGEGRAPAETEADRLIAVNSNP